MNNLKKTIVFLITSLEYGGAQTQLIPLAFELKKLGWQVRIVSMRPPEAFVEELQKADIPVDSLDMPKGVPDPRAIFKLVKLLNIWKPHILNAHMFHANLLARVSRLFYNVPFLISTAHNVNERASEQEDLDKASWFEIAYRLSDPLCDLTTTICKAGVERYIKVKAVPKEKVIYLPNSVDTNRFQPNLTVRDSVRSSLGIDEQFTWLAIGRFEKQKDYPTMISAFLILVSKFPKARLLICGTGSLNQEIEDLVGMLGLEENIKLLGIRKDIPQLMNAADAYVMSSAWEGMPIVLLEALATGLPIVATDVGGNSEIVIDGLNGYLSPASDDEALASQMEKLMSLSPAKLIDMGQEGINIVHTNHQLDSLSLKWNNLYNNMLDSQ